MFEMTPPTPPPGDVHNASVSRLKNMQVFEMTPQPVHPPGDVDISRLKNMQVFEMAPSTHPPGDVDVCRLKNLQVFEMAYQIHEIKINVTTLTVADQNGNPMTNFTQGDIVQLNFTVRNTGVPFANVLISTVVLDPSGSVAFLSYTYEDFFVGTQETFILGYRIPSDAPAGTYTAKVMVFTDWPSEGGVGLDVKTVTFNLN